MKRKGLTIKVNLSNRWLYTLIVIGILTIIGVGVYAFGTTSPSTFGHSVGELDFTGGFTVPSGDVKITSGKITAPQLCIGTDCKTAWPISGGLYGYCVWNFQNPSNSCQDAQVREPAYCYNEVCFCRSGYTNIITGQGGSSDRYYYYSCIKN